MQANTFSTKGHFGTMKDVHIHLLHVLLFFPPPGCGTGMQVKPAPHHALLLRDLATCSTIICRMIPIGIGSR
jgi:hypothetical protein